MSPMSLMQAATIVRAEVRASSAPVPRKIETGSDTEIIDLSYDSRKVTPGSLFFCIRGARLDGHRFAADAVRAGAVALVCEEPLHSPVPLLLVKDSLAAMNRLAAPFFGDPSSRLDVVGVTGTNGKTTTTHMLDSIFRAAGENTGLIGTVGAKIGTGAVLPAARTTPESIDLQRLLSRMVEAKATKCAMEVTSIALERGRVEGTRFKSVVFTNLTQDHLDDHLNMESYYEAKKRLFSRVYSARAAINHDDRHGRRLLGETDLDTLTFGVEPGAALKAEGIRLERRSCSFRARGPGIDREIRIPMPGRFNVSNGLAAAAGALLADVDSDAIALGLAGAGPVPGRMEFVDAGQDFCVMVDYAHTPAALEASITAAREVAPAGRLILVFGCGGDRDHGKRPLMGRAAGAADLAIVTSDNPRSEDPVGILAAIEKGLKRNPPREGYFVKESRREAIEDAISLANPGDTVIVAGKGHETGQEINGIKHPFDDREVALEALRAAQVR